MRKRLIIGGLVTLIVMLSVSYAWYSYIRIGKNQKMITSDVYLTLNDEVDTINLSAIYPQSSSEARERNDNVFTFSISGKNTSSNSIKYEFKLYYGAAKQNMQRFSDSDLRFDLIQVNNNNQEVYLLNAASFNSINNKKIWEDVISANTQNEVTRTYKIRMWLSDGVLISDTEPNANYTETSINGSVPFKDHYASVKLVVEGYSN